MNLRSFLLARISEDEAAVIPEWQFGNPSRVLAECQAKRALLRLWEEQPETFAEALRWVCSVYSSHPEYREQWTP